MESEFSYEDINQLQFITVNSKDDYVLYSAAELKDAYMNLLMTSHYHQEVASDSQTTEEAMKDIKTRRLTASEFAEFLQEREFLIENGDSGDPSLQRFTRSTNADSKITVGHVGPGGGYVFWTGVTSDGRQAALEVAQSNWYPENQDCPMRWCLNRDDLQSTKMNSRNIGDGILNRDAIADAQLFLCAPQVQIAQFMHDDEWCLPTIDELKLIYKNLIRNGLGDFGGSQYWSSSILVSPYVLSLDIRNGEELGTFPDTILFVRPVRLIRT